MDTNRTDRNRLGGVARFVLPLALGLVLGALLYAWFGATRSGQEASGSDASPDDAAEAATLPKVVQITAESQQETGISVERAASRGLRLTLSATGTVREDPGRVSHIRPLARGVVEKAYVRIGDRVSAGAPLVEYDNIELGVAIGEFLAAKAELQQSFTDIEVKKKILDRSQEMLRAGALARTTFDLREAEYKNRSIVMDGPMTTWRNSPPSRATASLIRF